MIPEPFDLVSILVSVVWSQSLQLQSFYSINLDVTHPALPASLTPSSQQTGFESRLANTNATCLCMKQEMSKFADHPPVRIIDRIIDRIIGSFTRIIYRIIY